MYTLIAYMSSGSHSHCGCCQGDSWDSDFLFEENLTTEQLINALSNRQLNNHNEHAEWSFIILQNGLRIYDSVEYNGLLEFSYVYDDYYNIDEVQQAALETEHIKILADIEQVFNKAKSRAANAKFERKRIDEEDKAKKLELSKLKNLENKRKQLEQLKKELGE